MSSSSGNLPIAVLAGGLATRLHPLVERVPKSLIPVAGKPFLERQFELLRNQGLTQIVLCVGHLGEVIRETIGDGSRYGLKVHYSADGVTPLGTGGALKRALPLLGNVFFVMYGDSYLPIDYAPVSDFFFRSGKLACMTVYLNDGRYDRSNVVFRAGEIKVFDKKQTFPEMRHIDYGLSIFRAQVFSTFPADTRFDLSDVLQELVAKDQLAGYEVNQRFYEVGSHHGLAELESYLGNLEGKR